MPQHQLQSSLVLLLIWNMLWLVLIISSSVEDNQSSNRWWKTNILSLITIAAKIHDSHPLTEEKKLHGKMVTRAYLVQSNPLPIGLRQRGYTWINCAEQRLNYVGWCITQASFCGPARTCSHQTLSCQQVFSSNSHSSKNRGSLVQRPNCSPCKVQSWNLMVDHVPKPNTYCVVMLRCKL